MPRIRQYNTQVSAEASIPSPRARASDFALGTAEIGKGLVDVAAVLHDNTQRAEVSDVQAKLAQARADWTLKLRQRAQETPTADYKSFAEKFAADFASSVEQIGGNLSTRAGGLAFREGSARLAAHFTEAAGLQQAQMAGNKATQDYLATLDAHRNTLLLDPSQFADILSQVTQDLNNASGPYGIIPADDRAKLERTTRSALAKSAVQGMIRVNPEAALEQVESRKYADFLDADTSAQLEGAAKQAINAERIEEARLKKAEKDALKEKQRETGNDFLTRLNEGSLTTKEILESNLDPTGENSKKTYLDMLKAKVKGDAKAPTSGGAGFVGLYERLYLSDDDPNKVRSEGALDDALLRGDISFQDHKHLRDEFQNLRGPDGRRLRDEKKRLASEVKVSITKSNPLQGKIDAPGDLQYGAYLDYVDTTLAKWREEGKPIFELFDSTSKEYLGRPEIIARFQKSTQQSAKDAVSRVTGRRAVEQRKPGETIEDYRKRTGK